MVVASGSDSEFDSEPPNRQTDAKINRGLKKRGGTRNELVRVLTYFVLNGSLATIA